MQLTNGCVCCTINGDLHAAVERTLGLDPPVDAIVVETTGLADPLPVGLTFLQTNLRARTSLDAVVTVVDCANFPLDLFATGPALAQIVHGDVIVLNKTDLVSPPEIESLERRIAILKPNARTLRSRFGHVPVEAVLDPLPVRTGDHGEVSPDPSPPGGGHGFQAEAFRYDVPLSAERFQAWLDEGLPPGVFRAKGLLKFNRPNQPFLFQLCGARATFDPWETDITGTDLVFIGRNLDRSLLAERLDACIATCVIHAERV